MCIKISSGRDRNKKAYGIHTHSELWYPDDVITPFKRPKGSKDSKPRKKAKREKSVLVGLEKNPNTSLFIVRTKILNTSEARKYKLSTIIKAIYPMSIIKIASDISKNCLHPIMKFCFGKKSKPEIIGVFILVVVAIVIGWCVMSLTNISQRLCITVDSFSFSTKESRIFTVGKGSDICFDRIPENYMTVTCDSNSSYFSWKIDRGRDSLIYYKINNVNPNLHPLTSSSTLKIEIPDLGVDSFSGNSIINILNNMPNEYVMLRTILMHDDSTMFTKIDGNPYVYNRFNSFVKVDRDCNERVDSVQVCILDPYTTLDNEGYCYGKTTKELGEEGKGRESTMKIQFFTISDFSYKTDEIKYVMKPLVVTTDWGAGHVMLHPENDGKSIHVTFPKCIMYVADLEKLRQNAVETSGVITLNQNVNSFPQRNILYIPQFSSLLSQTVARIQFFNDGSLHILDDRNTQEKIEGGFSIPSIWGPVLDSHHMTSGYYSVNCRVGIIGTKFVLSYLVLPLLFFLIIWGCSFYMFRIGNAPDAKIYNREQAKDLRRYFMIIALVVFAYCICKVMISLKLAYTYPYFEKLSHIATYNTSLMLLLFYAMSLIINHHFIFYNNSGKPPWKKMIIATGSVTFLLAFAMYGFHYTDGNSARELLASYYDSGDLAPYFSNPFRWHQKVGMMDNHRTVVYSLMFAVLLCIVVLIAVLICDSLKLWEKKYVTWIRAHRGWFLSPAFIICLVIVISLPGNFATAAITFIIVLGYGVVMSQIVMMKGEYKWKRVFIFVSMIIVALLLIILASVPDMGYLTYAFAFIVFPIMMFFLVKPTSGISLSAKEQEKLKKRENVTIFVGSALVITFIWYLPDIVTFIVGDTDEVSYERHVRRMHLYADYDDLKKSGYRYADSDVEFMVVLAHYIDQNSGGDPLDADLHFLHPSVSTGQSPVIMNDMSIQSAFFSSWGRCAYFAYFALLACLVTLVLTSVFNLKYKKTGIQSLLTMQTQWRLMAMLMWVSSTCYIFLSYVGFLPFTGRLNPGFGVDAVGEALESAILLAFMTATTFRNPSKS